MRREAHPKFCRSGNEAVEPKISIRSSVGRSRRGILPTIVVRVVDVLSGWDERKREAAEKQLEEEVFLPGLGI